MTLVYIFVQYISNCVCVCEGCGDGGADDVLS